MSEQQKKYTYIGKLKSTTTSGGWVNQTIYMDNVNHVNKDGTENKYYKGTLLWLDKETGKTYQVKQMNLFVPKDGMSPSDSEKGFVSKVTIALNDTFQATVLE
jgi:hypothetical protein